MTESGNPDIPLADKLNLETSLISWKELERFFANGSTIFVDQGLDLIDVGLEIAKDNTDVIQQWMADNKLSAVSDLQAQRWHDSGMLLWATVIKPWVLVQEKQVQEK